MNAAQLKFLFIPVSSECNLRCVHCKIWALKKNAISIDTKKRFIRAIAGKFPSIQVYLTGGEPFFNTDLLFELVSIIKKLGLSCATSTNGTLFSKNIAKKVVLSGLSNLVFSLDSHNPTVHNYLRNTPKTFEKASESIRMLKDARDKYNNEFLLYVSSILGAWNIENTELLVEYCQNELEIDGIMFQPLQPTFGQKSNVENLLCNPLFPTRTQIDSGIDSLSSVQRRNPKFVKESTDQIEAFRDYFHHPFSMKNVLCDSYQKNMMVDFDGNVSLCFNAWDAGFESLGNIKIDHPEKILKRRENQDLISKMKNCKRSCGLLICHRKGDN